MIPKLKNRCDGHEPETAAPALRLQEKIFYRRMFAFTRALLVAPALSVTVASPSNAV
jgi:hypothetical protein